MMHDLIRSRLLAILALAVMALVFSPPPRANAAPPANDNFTNAVAITSLPFTQAVDNAEATTEPGEPGFCGPTSQTLWYSFTPSSDVTVRADTSGSNFAPNELGLYQQVGSGFGGLAIIGCAFNNGDPIQVLLQAGSTYYFQAASFSFGVGGDLQLNVRAVPPPANDSFANATAFTSVPFLSTFDMSGATTEQSEPTPSCSGPAPATVWYAFTPSVSSSYRGIVSGATTWVSQFGVYTGSSLGTLTEVSCGFGNPFAFHATAGTTYYIQIGNHAGRGGPAQFALDFPPPPTAAFVFSPSDPSSFDTVSFFDFSFDPDGSGINAWSWDFGDGSGAQGAFPTHRYRSDGDYTVTESITTSDGRSGSTSQQLSVRTHDVAIWRFATPTVASAGKTDKLTVSISNHRYPETVAVEFYRSSPSGFEFVGSKSVSVPVLPASRTTAVSLNYTFTSADKAIGKVTFEAIAVTPFVRDVLPADNQAVSSPTRVN
jgi:PKD domain